MYKVYRKGVWPKKKKDFYAGRFEKRQAAINFCRKRYLFEDGLTIVHPNGSEEIYTK